AWIGVQRVKPAPSRPATRLGCSSKEEKVTSVSGLSLIYSVFVVPGSQSGRAACIDTGTVAHCGPCAGSRDVGLYPFVRAMPQFTAMRPSTRHGQSHCTRRLQVSDKVLHVGDADFDSAVLQSGEP